MFGLQPQLSQSILPLSHLSSLLNSVGRLSRTCSQPRVTTSQTAPAHHQQNKEAQQVQELVSYLKELGLEHLPAGLQVSDLSPVLSCDSCQTTRRPHWASSYTSATTFFENKNGFSEQDLEQNSYIPPHMVQISAPNIGLLSRLQHSNAVQQRGFKTRSRAVGLGSKKKLDDEDLSAIDNLKKSVFGKVFNREKGSKESERFKTMVREYEHAPEMQDRMKVAFAEGYTANKGKEAEKPTKWMFTFVKYGLIIWLVFYLINGYSSLGGNMNIKVLKGERFEVNPEEITITFDDVKGVDEAKQELKDIVEFLRDPDKFKTLGAKLPKGVLLVGPPGIGKTLLARAVAGEAGVPFFHASGSEFDEIFVGTGAKRVRQLFDAAKVRAPCVIFIDEIDTVGAKRTSSQIHPYANQTINQLLSEMDGFQQNEGVIVLGATNRRDNLDKALLRPGRFDVEVRVFAPDLKGRADILALYLTKITHSKDIDIEQIARGTTGCTGADLENVVNQAALKAAMEGAKEVTMVHMEFAKDKVLMGPAKKTKIPDEETNLMTAYHEAGHTLVAYYTKDSTPLHKVTIVPRGMSLGHTSFVPEKEQYNISKSQLMAQMDVAMGGRVAEELIYGQDKVTTGASSDFQQATAIASSMVKVYGMSEKVGVRVFSDEAFDSGLSMLKVNDLSQTTNELVDSEIKRLLSESYDRAKTILKNHSAEHKALAKALMKYETLDVDDIHTVVNGKTLKKNGAPNPS